MRLGSIIWWIFQNLIKNYSMQFIVWFKTINNEKLRSKRHKMEEFLKLIVQINSDNYTDTWWYHFIFEEKILEIRNGKGICAQRTILVLHKAESERLKFKWFLISTFYKLFLDGQFCKNKLIQTMNSYYAQTKLVGLKKKNRKKFPHFCSERLSFSAIAWYELNSRF